MTQNSLLRVSAMLLASVVGLMGDSKITTLWVRGHPRMIRNSLFRVSAALLASVLGLGVGYNNVCLLLGYGSIRERSEIAFCMFRLRCFLLWWV